MVHKAERAAAYAVNGETVDGAEGVVPRVALGVAARRANPRDITSLVKSQHF